jgi:tetratricopeptide (TPR) repeat protein
MSENKNKEDVEQEEFDSFSDDNIQAEKGWNAVIQRNGRLIIIFSLALIVLVGLIVLFRANSQKNEANATKALARIEDYYLKGEYENALNGNDTLPLIRGEKIIGLKDIVSEYGSTSAGQRAALYAGESYFILGKFPEAKNYYEKAIQSNIDVIKVGGLVGVAACNEKVGKIKDAAEGYIKASTLIQDEGLKLRYMYFAGLCNEKTGNNDAAKKIYRDIINLNKFGEFNNLAKAGIVRLGEDIE